MPGSVLTALAAGALSGLMIAATNFAGLAAMPLVIVALVPTFAIGLSKGLTTVLFALAAATVVTAAVGSLELALKYAVVFAAPQAWLTRQALLSHNTPSGVEWYPPGMLMAWVTGIAALFVTAATLAFAGAEGGLVGAIQQNTERELHALVEAQVWQFTADDVQAMAPALASMVPAAMANLWVLVIVGNGALAQALLARSGRNLRPSLRFPEFEVPAILMYALGAALLLSLVPDTLGFLGKTLVTVITAAYFILGLAVIHAVARGIAARRPLLIATYLLMIVLPWLAVAVIVLGLAEQVLGLRRRFFGAKKGRKEE